MDNFLFQKFIQSSEFKPEELTDPSIPFIREIVFRASSLIFPVVILLAALFYWCIGLYSLAILGLFVSIFLVVNVYQILNKNRRLVPPTALILMALALLIITIVAGMEDFIFFCYAMPVAIYLLLDPFRALLINAVFLFICALLATYYLPSLQAVSFLGGQGSTVFLLHIIFSILGRKEKLLTDLVILDPLTNAYNRRAMREFLQEAIKVNKRYNTPHSIVMVDIDHFKSINDNFGHDEGDRVLKNLVTRFRKRIRDTDKLCRYGGEEFLFILSNTTGEQAYQFAESIRMYIADGELSLYTKITISCGIAAITPDDSVDTWMKRGDQALYQAKNAGRNRVVVDPGIGGNFQRHR